MAGVDAVASCGQRKVSVAAARPLRGDVGRLAVSSVLGPKVDGFRLE